ncbi:MAG TPA: hypothetical protein VGR96_17285 [Acidobacteriaceae bacterium]|nr:hypothetical protein [Acidobacteriaceae bacterium]
MKTFLFAISTFLLIAAPAFADVTVSSPWNGETVGSQVHYVATASTSTCSSGVASMGVYVDNQLTKVVYGTSMDTTVPVSSGNHNTVVEEWDYCGGATFTPVSVNVSDQSGVWVSSPANNSQVSSPANYVATATASGCSKGVAAMGIYVNNNLTYVVNGAKLNTQLPLGSGNQNTVVEEWDYCGGASYTPVNVNVQGGGGNSIYNIQASGGWTGSGELAPAYDVCGSNCPGVNWSMWRGVQSPSISGNATGFYLGGSTPYSDALWSNPLIGQFSTQGLPDSDHSLLPTLHNFTYDAYFYGSNLGVTQVLEFDINMYLNGVGMIWGNQCRIAGGNEWDIWDNVNAQWVPTGVACNPVSNAWNHVTIQVQRESDNSLLFQSITLNGVTANINKTYPPFSVPQSWWGITVNYQMDGNYQQAGNTTYLDNFTFTYW